MKQPSVHTDVIPEHVSFQSPGLPVSPSDKGVSGVFLALSRHFYTLYLFTVSDFVSVLIPQTLFAVFSAVSGQFMSKDENPCLAEVLLRLPHVVAWTWLQLLVLDLANQRLPGSMAEDALNKPWRPIPARRITAEGARQLLAASIVVTLAVSTRLGGTTETLLLFTENWLYNDLGLANGHWLVRNLMNAAGITTIGMGATRVACGPSEADLSGPATYRWWLLCAGMLMSTIHIQDLYDQEGDAARGRGTAPLVIGDGPARWSISAAVLVWSAVMPASMGLGLPGHWTAYMAPVLLGLLVVARVLSLRDVAADKRTFKLWALWTICLYSIPLVTGTWLDINGL